MLGVHLLDPSQTLLALVVAAREPGEGFSGLPELLVEGLRIGDARELLSSVARGKLDERVQDRILAETGGNPLALLELPRGLMPAQLTGGFGVSSAVPLDGRIEESLGRQLEALPRQTQRLVQLAAADPTGDPVLVWRAAGRLAIGAGAAGPAAEAGLAEFGARVRFRHPLVRSAAYRSASVQTRQELHGALAEATDPAADPDRRAWHRAQATPGPDEEVAAELEQCAGRAQRRGGLAAAAGDEMTVESFRAQFNQSVHLGELVSSRAVLPTVTTHANTLWSMALTAPARTRSACPNPRPCSSCSSPWRACSPTSTA